MSSSPYTIEIVPVDRGWILETMAKAIERHAALSPQRYNVRIVDTPTDRAELTFFLPESAYRPLEHSITVTYLAHKEDHPGAAALFEEVARNSDYCVTSSTKYQQVLERDGARKVFKVHLGVDTELFTPKLRLGVVGRTYHTGRKGESLLAGLAGVPEVELRFTGAGWPYPAGHYDTDDLAQFYRGIDYLLIPSLIEGGPVPLLEALSSGCPVIAPSDIGLVEDFPHVPFKRGDAKDLRRVVEELLRQKLSLRESVLGCDWKEFARHHLDIFTDLIEQRRQTRSALTPVAPPQTDSVVRALLVTHGTEDAAKGGPSTRVHLIVSRLQAAGHFVETRHNIRSVADLADFDVTHIFNSWPPQTALECLALAKKAGKAVVFSPIALDLADWPIYRQLMEYAFSTGGAASAKALVQQLAQLAPKRRYTGAGADKPIEGVPGHFEALRQCCTLADHLVFLSELERDFLTALGAKTDHGTLIHNGVSDAFSGNIDSDLFRKRFGFDRYVLCVGRIEYRKNQALLALAMREMDVPLVLIGDVGDEGYLEHTRQLGGTNLFHYARIEDKALLASAYAGASVFVLPSWCEGAPLAALEAGLTGVPLILSDRSSEMEYFGDYADYVSPADAASMRIAIQNALARNEPPQIRTNRASFLRARYSEVEHAQCTLELYRHAIPAGASARSHDVVIDISSLLHSLRVGGHLTGVPLAEHNLVAEVVATYPAVRCIAYNDVKDQFVEIEYSDLKPFNPDAFNRRYWFSDESPGVGSDCRLMFTPPPVQQPATHTQEEEEPAQPSRWDYWAIGVVGLLTRAGLSAKTISRIGQMANWLRSMAASSPAMPAPEINVAGEKDPTIDFSNASCYLEKVQIPRPVLDLAPGSRILTLGQGWLSNEPLLNKLVGLAACHFLEAYVYDISYVSGAHFSGWGDNDDRQRRLTKLLRHCHTVFTESRTTSSELAKFAASRSLFPQIIRTQLRGKDVGEPGNETFTHNTAPFILYVSSFNRRKNHDFIVSVWRDLIATNSQIVALGVRLLLVGEVQGETKYGDPAYLDSLRHFNIDVTSNIGDAQLSEYYHRCLFTVFPSLQEGWGIPIQESLMHGKVCLASSTAPATIEIDNAALIKLDPHDFFGWREAITTWTTNSDMRTAFEARAISYSPPTWPEIANRILNLRSTP